MRALAARVLRDHRFTVVETGEDDFRTYGMAALGCSAVIGPPFFLVEGLTTGAMSSFVGSAMCAAVAAISYLEAFPRWPRRAETMKVIDAALHTGDERPG